jgi:hypothetical protein
MCIESWIKFNPRENLKELWTHSFDAPIGAMYIENHKIISF